MKNEAGKAETERIRAFGDRLKDLNKRMGRDVEDAGKESGAKSAKAGYGNAFRLSTEFISAILVGAAIGYGIDWVAGTLPWGMIVFLMLGFVAGVLNVLRASGEIASPAAKKAENSAELSDES